jgi:hypothetical protein
VRDLPNNFKVHVGTYYQAAKDAANRKPAMKIRTEDWEKVSPVCSLIFISGGEAPLHDR